MALLAGLGVLDLTVRGVGGALGEQSLHLRQLGQVNASVLAFNELKYWLFDRMAGLLLADINWVNKSQSQIKTAQGEFLARLDDIGEFAPAAAEHMRHAA